MLTVACAEEDGHHHADGPANHDEVMPDDNKTPPQTETMTRALAIAFEGLEPLGADYVYEGWLIVDKMPVSTGIFRIDEDGMPTISEFEVTAENADAATLFVLTIEPAVDDDPAPSAVKVLAGELTDGAADLSIGHAAALGTDLADAAAGFILKTPTTGDTDEDDNQGIWFLELTDEGPAASMWLPELPEGWVYEGWVVGDDGPISTGTFSATTGEDSDGPGATAGPDGYPPFPGQDFIDPALNLVGLTAVISIEPQPDNSPAPFALKPLVTPSIEWLGGGVLQSMENKSSTNTITGSAWFKAVDGDAWTPGDVN